jgi:phosphate transport system substrate-binding protein
MKKGIGLIVAVSALLVSACGQPLASPASSPPGEATAASSTPSATERTIDPALIARDYPRVDGSTSAYPLQLLLACKILDVPCDWQEGTPFDRTRTIAPIPGSETSPQGVERIFNIQHSGTHGSYISLIKGDTDFILVARPPSHDELRAARWRWVKLDLRPVALDAFVFLVSTQNSVDDLSVETIRDIYTGRVTRWSEVGASIAGDRADGDPISAYSRNPNSGSQELMEQLVMRGDQMIEAPDMMLPSMMGPLSAIDSDPSGIGYSVYYYATFMLPTEGVKLIGVDGVSPTSANIADRSYPLTTEVYAVIREGMRDDHGAVLLRDWLLSAEGQVVVEESGYVPVGQ